MTKSWELSQEQRWNRRKRGYDLVIVDGPASGHAVGMLRTPGTFADIARVGPIASQSERVREFLGDSRRSAYVAVALPAELPVSETLDLGRRLRKAIGRRVETVVVNGVLPDRFDGDELARVSAAGADGCSRTRSRAPTGAPPCRPSTSPGWTPRPTARWSAALRLPRALLRDDVEALAERLADA
jgi:anion-transporting  ArsA/GET3 family ATPase